MRSTKSIALALTTLLTVLLIACQHPKAVSDPKLASLTADGSAAVPMPAWTELEGLVTHAGAKGAAFVVPGYPRGRVRMKDLAEFRIDVGEEFDTPGKLMFKRGKTVLYAVEFDPQNRIILEPVPAAVRKALKSGALVTWGFYPVKGKPRTAKFKVVKDDPRLTKRIARMEERMKNHAEVDICQLRAQLYLNKKLYTAAYLEGLRALEVNPDKAAPPAQALTVMQSATQRMKLRKTPIWDEIERDASKLPDRIKERRKRFKGRSPK